MFNRKEYMIKYRLDNKDKIKKRDKIYNEKHKEIIKNSHHKYYLEHKIERKNWQEQYNLEHQDEIKKWQKEHHLKNKYKLTIEQYNELLIKQNNKCAICGETFITTPHIDHDHITGKVRGLLCKKHNLLLGNANDNINILNNAIKYLESFI
jgi:hypothetical protein